MSLNDVVTLLSNLWLVGQH